MSASTQVMTLYLNEVGAYPRITREQEQELALRAERGRAAQRKLEQKPLPSVERCKRLQAQVTLGKAAQRQLIESNLRLVVYWARRHNPHGLPIEDLVQEGNVGLMKAIERFDPREGVRLATYAQWWIKKALYKAASDSGALIRMPEKANQERLRLRRTFARLEMSLTRAPTQAELAAELDIPQTRVASVQRWDREYISLDAPVGSDTETSLADLIPDHDRPSPDECATHKGLCDLLRKVIETHLGPQEQRYVRVRFGLSGGPPRTQLQAAHYLGMTKKHAAQIEKRALRQLRSSQILHDWRA